MPLRIYRYVNVNDTDHVNKLMDVKCVLTQPLLGNVVTAALQQSPNLCHMTRSHN